MSDAPAKRYPIQREWAVQRGVKFFVKRCVAVEHEFASHDRGRARSEIEHIGEAARGIRKDWLDTELVLVGGVTFRCELKAPDVAPKGDSGQTKMINRLNALGHPAAWANSVLDYGRQAEWCAVPLLPNWRVVAAHADELVAADIRQQEVRAEKKRAGTYKAAKPHTKRLAASGRRAAASYAGLLR